ncbi:MAG TPA: type VI secretion system contractile sheath small subunit [Chitinispirillaceae bacterium]|jgi:type VI secretion system protein ImpB|nr:type VI secretion system contractile sheath small subunit [Chitinispirillaceae bacterium]
MAGSFQNEIPSARINLKLDVGKGDAKKKTELPLKMLVLGDFSFKNKSERVTDREKISINKNNFEQVMESLDLNLNFNVDNKISNEGELNVDLDIKNMNSFKPENVAKNVPALSRLLGARNLIKDLKSNLLDNREFRKRLEDIIKDPNAVQSLQEELKKIVPEEKKDSEEKPVEE